MSKKYFTTASATHQDSPLLTFETLKKTIDSLKIEMGEVKPSPTIVGGKDCSELWDLANVQKLTLGVLPFAGATIHTSELLPDNFLLMGSGEEIYIFKVQEGKLHAWAVTPEAPLYKALWHLLNLHGFGVNKGV